MQIVGMRNISKSFGDTHALKDVSFELEQGEILSLLGENGAGKTTLMKILYGMLAPDEGEIFFENEKVEFKRPIDAINTGICMVHQHFMLVPQFTVTENIIAGIEPVNGIVIDEKRARKEVGALIEKFSFHLDPDALVETLSVGEQQRVEILKALYREAKVLILDEPTAVLTPSEVSDLFETLGILRSQGTSIVIITHKLYETMALADRVAVLRDGVMIRSDVDPAKSNVIELSDMMVGRPIKLDLRRPSENIGEPLLSVRNLTVLDRGIEKLRNISFDIKSGEIYGFAGVEGNGQTQLLEALTGLIKPASMELTLNGKPLSGEPGDFIKNKVGHVPEDRSDMGLVLKMSVRENLFLGYHDFPDMHDKFGFLKEEYINKYADRCVKDFQIKTRDVEIPVKALSGGNQQKVVMARVLSRDLDLMVIAHPTRGLDIGSSEYMHEQIIKFRDSGKAVLLVSADLDEICTLSDRLAVLYDGNIVVECEPDDFTQIELGLLMTGSPLERVTKGREMQCAK